MPSPASALLTRTIARFLEPAAIALLAAALLLWLGDYAVFRYRLSRGNGIGSVQVNEYLAVPLKNGREQFDYTGTENVPCAHALFPQTQGSPCWYVARHRDQRTAI